MQHVMGYLDYLHGISLAQAPHPSTRFDRCIPNA
jgi:hypothetical protein